MSRVFEALQRSGTMPTRVNVNDIARPQEFPSIPLAMDLDLGTRHVSNVEDAPALPSKLDGPGRLSALKEHGDIGSEKFSILGTRLNSLQTARGIKRLLITSSTKEEGKSLMAANIAISLARHSTKKVLLIEGDLRRPKLGQLFGVSDLAGLSEHMAQTLSPMSNVYRFQNLKLWCLFAGRDCSRPVELLQSSKLADLLNELGTLFDWIIIDAPPVAALADADLWSRLVDGVLVVVREGVTSKKLLTQTLRSIQPQQLCGVVL